MLEVAGQSQRYLAAKGIELNEAISEE